LNDGFFLNEVPAFVKVAKIVFFEHMPPDDARQYREFFQQAKDQVLTARAGKLGIELANAMSQQQSPLPSAISR
jgi:hypothetical protein